MSRLCKFPTVCVFYYYPPIAYIPIDIQEAFDSIRISARSVSPTAISFPAFPAPLPCASQSLLWYP